MRNTARFVSICLLTAAALAAACADSTPSGPADADVSDTLGDAPGDAATDLAVPDSGDSSDTGPDTTPPPDLSTPLLPGEVRAGVVTRPNELLTGPKAEGRLGDVRIDNAHVAFIIEGARRAAGFRYWGGHVVDAAPVGPDGSPGADYYGETFFGYDLATMRPDTVEVLADGTSGEAHVRITGRTVPLDFAAGLLAKVLLVDPPDLGIAYDYYLGPDDRALRLDITLTNDTPKYLAVDYVTLIAAHGDGAAAYVPPFGFDNRAAVGIPVDSFAVAGRDLAYGILSAIPDILLLGTYQGLTVALGKELYMDAGTSAVTTYRFAVTRGGPDALARIQRQLSGASSVTARVSGAVTLPETAPAERSWVVAWRGDDLATLAPVAPDGSYDLELDPAAGYEIQAFSEHHAASPRVGIDLAAGDDSTVALAIPAAAVALVEVFEAATGKPEPARVSFVRQGATPSDSAPAAARVYEAWGDSIGGVAYHLGVPERVVLPAGTYEAVAARGFSYELERRVVDLPAGQTTPLSFTIERVVDTTGWVSADFHVHAEGSHDSFVPLDIRALQAFTDDLDLPVVTEHDVIGAMADVELPDPLNQSLIRVPATEATTLSYGHFNAFPLIYDPSALNRGAVHVHDKQPAELFEALRAQNPADEILQVNHPRTIAAGGYFSYIGLDGAANTVKKPDEWSMNWDAIEALSVDCGDSNNNPQTIQDWIGLTNHGHRKVLSSGSDTHDVHITAGSPRNWIQADPATLRADSQALVPPVRGRQMFVSCGPFVRFQAADGTGLGGMTAPATPGGPVELEVVVEAPTWIAIDEVRLWENGVPIQVVDVTAAAAQTVRLDTIFTVTPAADAWYSVEVVGHGSMKPVTRAGPPYALTNPIEVDADLDGTWTPPGDLAPTSAR
ncbi:MAG: CehA/McbA family metallohydrolase [Myxococcota bacterium]